MGLHLSPNPPVPDWRGVFQNDEVNALHFACFGGTLTQADWWAQVNAHSLGWVCLRSDERLVGFVNVVGDGRTHAILFDLIVAVAHRRKGFGRALVSEAIARARAADCRWMHVDFEPGLRDFYRKACGFSATDAGLLALRSSNASG